MTEQDPEPEADGDLEPERRTPPSNSPNRRHVNVTLATYHKLRRLQDIRRRQLGLLRGIPLGWFIEKWATRELEEVSAPVLRRPEHEAKNG
jgi:hypothetical protein